MRHNEIDSATGALYQLQDAVCLLASEPEHQADYLDRHGYGTCLDELALNLDAWYHTGETWEFHRLLNADQLASLELLDKQLEWMSREENKGLWLTDALNSQEWMLVRQLGRNVLDAFGYEFQTGLRRELSRRWPDSWASAW